MEMPIRYQTIGHGLNSHNKIPFPQINKTNGLAIRLWTLKNLYVSKLDSLELLLNWKGPTMIFAQPIIFAIFAALYIYIVSAEKAQEASIYDPTPEMLLNMVKKTKRGWFCAGVYCPKKRTASCKTTTILKPTSKIEYDLVVLCLNGTNYPFCGVTRSSRVVFQEIVELDDEGNMEYVSKERITTREGIRVPYCQIRGTSRKG